MHRMMEKGVELDRNEITGHYKGYLKLKPYLKLITGGVGRMRLAKVKLAPGRNLTPQ